MSRLICFVQIRSGFSMKLEASFYRKARQIRNTRLRLDQALIFEAYLANHANVDPNAKAGLIHLQVNKLLKTLSHVGCRKNSTARDTNWTLFTTI